jgi:hypothetical protein
MASLLSTSEKSILNVAFNDIHDTFARDIYVYVESISSIPIDQNYNSLYGRTKNSSRIDSQKTLQKFTYSARVYYENSQKENVVDTDGQMNLSASLGLVKIKVKQDAYEKIKVCSRIEVDNQLYIVYGDVKVIGNLGINFYTYTLKREN